MTISVDTAQQHGARVDEADCGDAANPGGQELLPGRADTAGRGIDPGAVQDLPHRGGRDRVAGPDRLALHPPVPHAGFCVAIRITSVRIAAAVEAARVLADGSRSPLLRATSRRCQPGSVAGATGNT
jgi:hypothetical protein